MTTVDLNFFDKIQTSMDSEAKIKDEIRQAVRDFDRTCRAITAVLNQVHASSSSEMPAICDNALHYFVDARGHLTKLASLVPEKQFYKYNDLWNRTVQQACFLATFTTYLQYERLITIAELEEILGVKVNINNDLQYFHISIEDVLHSFVSMTNELVRLSSTNISHQNLVCRSNSPHRLRYCPQSRLAVNSVTAGDYSRPLRISKFVKDLGSGFQLLNLKNDLLRKRFDGIKYDIKKIEEVVYDISLRGLTTNTVSSAATAMVTDQSA
ncbi:translin-like protein [Jimgerdemannia flammicorona]|uniref:Translin-like protein n=1 Tax=Jimgerdemannia flammicorona TaxID=994334 RepID=A0A433DJV8_9FUNG|nr:translin-like protein [Jimgerdemannia flammicorona]